MAGRDETLAHVYGDAMLDLVFEQGVHAEVLNELKELGRILAAEERFVDFLNSPNIRVETKKEVLERVFGGGVSDVTLNFVKVVLDKRRQVHLPEIVEAFVTGYHERMGEVVVRVDSAVALEDEHRERLTRALKRKYNKEIILEERVKPQLLGGLVLWVGDARMDGSVRSRLETVGRRLEGAHLQSEDYYED